MAQIKLSEAAALTGKSEKTLYRHASQGRLSVTVNENGQKTVETSELHRVYGSLRSNDSQSVQTMPLSENSFESERESLKAVNLALKMVLDEKDKRIELLTYSQEQKKPLTWLWVLIAIVISVLATNLAYRIPSPF
jgi:hypothetical protein